MPVDSLDEERHDLLSISELAWIRVIDSSVERWMLHHERESNWDHRFECPMRRSEQRSNAIDSQCRERVRGEAEHRHPESMKRRYSIADFSVFLLSMHWPDWRWPQDDWNNSFERSQRLASMSYVIAKQEQWRVPFDTPNPRSVLPVGIVSTIVFDWEIESTCCSTVGALSRGISRWLL